MKANELRVGNLFYPINRIGPVHLPETNYPMRVITIGLFKVESCLIDENPAQIAVLPAFDLHSVSPIPLTEEWLLKFGWGKSGEHELSDNSDPEFDFVYDTHFNKLYLYSANNTINLPKIEYVHQLQNLYYALTGEELIT